jgi:hypothetical protein
VIRTIVGLVLLASCSHRPVVTARDLLGAPERFDGADVVVVGQVMNPRFRMPEQGNSYTTFTLADGTAQVPVFGWGKLDIDSGDIVEVRGAFRHTAAAGSDLLRDVVEVLFVRRLRAAPGLRGPAGVP